MNDNGAPTRYVVVEAPVAAVHMDRREVLLEDGRSVPFLAMFDEYGSSTDNIHEAATALVCHPDHEHAVLIIDLTSFEVATLH